jgi:hypothetical protein
MIEEKIKTITHTIGGYEVKDLKYKKADRVITGRVKDPSNLFPHLYEGFVSCVWNSAGFPQRDNKGRKDMKIEL